MHGCGVHVCGCVWCGVWVWCVGVVCVWCVGVVLLLQTGVMLT